MLILYYKHGTYISLAQNIFDFMVLINAKPNSSTTFLIFHVIKKMGDCIVLIMEN